MRHPIKEMSKNAQKLVDRFETSKIIDKWRFLIDLCLNNSDEKIREILETENKDKFNEINAEFAKNLIAEYETCLKNVILNPVIKYVNVKVPVETSVYIQPSKRKRIANNRVWRLFYRCLCRPILKIIYGKEKVHRTVRDYCMEKESGIRKRRCIGIASTHFLFGSDGIAFVFTNISICPYRGGGDVSIFKRRRFGHRFSLAAKL